MASTSRCNGGPAPVAKAMLDAACVAALAGAVALAALFTVTMLPTLEYSVVHISMWHSPPHSPPPSPAEINAIVASVAARTFAVSLVLSLVIAAPVSAVLVLCAYPFLHELHTAGRTASGIVGFLTGALAWAGLWCCTPNIHFGPWMSWFIVGGVAGCAGGLAFAWRLSRQR